MIWIIEDHQKLRKTLREALTLSDSSLQVEDFPSCEDAIIYMEEYGLYPVHSGTVQGTVEPPEVIILDIGLPGISGLEGIRMLKTAVPDAEILMFTVCDDRERIFEAICAGASGFLLKEESLSRIVAAVEEVKNGGVPMSPEIARQVIDRFKDHESKTPQNPVPGSAGSVPLSEQEQKVLQLLADGLTRKEIATQMSLSPHTIDCYIRRIYTKLHVSTVGGAVAKALREGLM